MAVAHETATESHTGTTGSASQASFDISVPFTASSKGLLVFTFVNANADNALSVKIDPAGANTDVPAVTGGRAVDTAGEPGDCKAWFLGSGLPTGTTTVRINRTNNANVMYAAAITVTAGANTAIHGAGIVLLQEDGTLTGQSVTDGSPGTNSLRYAGVNSGLPSVPSPDTGSTTIASIDLGSRVVAVVREDTAGQGARNVGSTSSTSEDRAGVYLAVKEAGASTQNLTGSLFTKAPTFFTGLITSIRALTGSLFVKAPIFFTGTVTATRALTGVLFAKAPTFPTGVVTPGVRNLTGTLFTKAPTFPTGAVSLAAGPQTLNGVLFAKAPTFPTGTVTATYALTGVLFTKAPTFPQGTVTTGAVTLTGTLFTKTPTFPQGAVTIGAVSLTGVLFQKAPTFPTGAVTTGTATLTGSLFVKAPTFFTGTIGQAGTLFGNLYVNTSLFFNGTMGQLGGSFWRPNPVAYTLAPVGYTPIGPGDVPPWGIDIEGVVFVKAPTFPVGTVT